MAVNNSGVTKVGALVGASLTLAVGGILAMVLNGFPAGWSGGGADFNEHVEGDTLQITVAGEEYRIGDETLSLEEVEALVLDSEYDRVDVIFAPDARTLARDRLYDVLREHGIRFAAP